jgi:hypothetical protein
MGTEEGIDQKGILSEGSQSGFHRQRFFQQRSMVRLDKWTVPGIQKGSYPFDDPTEALQKDLMIVRSFGITGNPDRRPEHVDGFSFSRHRKQGDHNGPVTRITFPERPPSFRTPLHPVHSAMVPPLQPFQKTRKVRTVRWVRQNSRTGKLNEGFPEDPAGTRQILLRFIRRLLSGQKVVPVQFVFHKKSSALCRIMSLSTSSSFIR